MKKHDEVEKYDEIPYAEAKKAGVVKTYREFKRRYWGFYVGRDHAIKVLKHSEFRDDEVSDEEVAEWIDDTFDVVEEAGLTHLFLTYDPGFEVLHDIEEAILAGEHDDDQHLDW